MNTEETKLNIEFLEQENMKIHNEIREKIQEIRYNKSLIEEFKKRIRLRVA